ncbi:MAG: Arabinan endo,5-alpha-L-arabinosidase [Cyanobacteria bacterium RYN_339]|nr:Arabinan endo,5-alpha-L-arabinosidase [Cyanobacteria bacterium RYN_339]
MSRIKTCLLGSLLLLVAGCGHGTASPLQRPNGGVSAQGLWPGKPPAVRAGRVGGQIAVTSLNTPFIKDPSFVDGARPIEGTRYIAFGDLRGLYIKAFDVDLKGGPLAFRDRETKLTVNGVAAGLDALWAPQLVSRGDRLDLYFSAGAMPPPSGPRWETFRIHRAGIRRADFAAALAAGRSPAFQDEGVILDDARPFPDGDYGVIDPALFVNAHGRAYMTYTVVRAASAAHGSHEEFVRSRRVDPADPVRPLGPEQAIFDGKAGTEDDGVAEAQDVVTLGGHAFVFLSSRPGDVDQRLLVAPIGDDLGRVERPAVKEFMYGGAEPWKARAIGSSSAAEIDGKAYMVYQGLDAAQRFTLGWTTLEQ